MVIASVSVICLIGLPASGKSMLAREIETRYKIKYNIEIICFDKEICWHEEKSWKNKRNAVRNLVIHHIVKNLNFLNKITLIILDDNMFYRSMRYEYFQVARKYNTGFCEIYLNTGLDMCLKLNNERAERVSESTIINMNRQLERPDSNVYKWENNHLILNQLLSKNDWKNLEEMVLRSLQRPAKNAGKTVSKTSSTNFLHTADIALRKIVNELIKSKLKSKGNLEEHCSELTKKRRLLLEKIRTGEIKLPESCCQEHYVQLFTEFLNSEL